MVPFVQQISWSLRWTEFLEEYGGRADVKLDVVFGKLFLCSSELSSGVHILQKELLPCGNTVSIKGFICSATKLRQVVLE